MDQDYFSEGEIEQFRKRKVKIEINAAKRLIENGIDPLEITNNLIHETFEIMRNGIRSKNPELNQSQTEEEVMYLVKLAEFINKKGKKR